MSSTSYSDANAHSVLMRAKREKPMFDRQEFVERTVHGMQDDLNDLLQAIVCDDREYVAQNEARLLSILSGLQWICSDLRESRLRRVHMEAAE